MFMYVRVEKALVKWVCEEVSFWERRREAKEEDVGFDMGDSRVNKYKLGHGKSLIIVDGLQLFLQIVEIRKKNIYAAVLITLIWPCNRL